MNRISAFSLATILTASCSPDDRKIKPVEPDRIVIDVHGDYGPIRVVDMEEPQPPEPGHVWGVNPKKDDQIQTTLLLELRYSMLVKSVRDPENFDLLQWEHEMDRQMALEGVPEYIRRYLLDHAPRMEEYEPMLRD